MLKQITVSVCTFNRAALLPRALDSLLAQSMNSELFEILVVDNGSTDATPEIVKEYQKKRACLRYIEEPTPGVARARNRAMKETAGNFLAFLDDDAEAAPDWLEELSRPMLFPDQNPAPACIAGPVFLEWEGGRPEWFPVKYETLYCHYERGKEPRFLKADEYFLTTNVLFDVEILRRQEGFRTYLGPSRKKPMGGEDNDIYQRMFAAGHRTLYQPAARVFHRASKERQRRSYLLKRLYWDGFVQPRLSLSRDKKYHAWTESYYDAVCFLRAILEFFRGIFMGKKEIIWDAIYQAIQKLGRFFSDLQIAMGMIR